MIAAGAPFWDQVALNATPPLVTAVFGLLVVGLAVNYLTRVLQDRRNASQLKYDLVSQMTEIASTILHYAGMYREARMAPDSTESRDGIGQPNQDLAELRSKLHELYAAGRAQTDKLEALLGAYFDEPRIAVAWHAVRDCLAVRYQFAVGGREEYLREVSLQSSKGWDRRYHTGLSAAELADRLKVWKAYDCHLKTATKLVLACPLRPQRITRRSSAAIDSALETARELGFDYKEPVDIDERSS
jgi:hypothetical protein